MTSGGEEVWDFMRVDMGQGGAVRSKGLSGINSTSASRYMSGGGCGGLSEINRRLASRSMSGNIPQMAQNELKMPQMCLKFPKMSLKCPKCR